MFNQKIRRAIRLALAGGAAAGAMYAVPATAQDQEAGLAEGEDLGKIVVTGSRIPRANLTAPTAVTTIDAEVIEQSGQINVADILRAVPSFGVSGLSTGQLELPDRRRRRQHAAAAQPRGRPHAGARQRPALCLRRRGLRGGRLQHHPDRADRAGRDDHRRRLGHLRLRRARGRDQRDPQGRVRRRRLRLPVRRSRSGRRHFEIASTSSPAATSRTIAATPWCRRRSRSRRVCCRGPRAEHGGRRPVHLLRDRRSGRLRNADRGRLLELLGIRTVLRSCRRAQSFTRVRWHRADRHRGSL